MSDWLPGIAKPLLLSTGAVFLLLSVPLPAAAQSCGDPESGSCLEGNGSAACASTNCCNTVCTFDPFCCDTQWDPLCAEGALKSCSVAVNGVSPSSGPEAGGTWITIEGELLSGPAASTDVSVGGTPCNDVVITDARVACETPAGIGPADVSVVNNEPGLMDNSDTVANAYSYKPDNCGVSGSGSCLSANGSAGCTSDECCTAVCDTDDFCCGSEWDSLCAEEALAVCRVSINTIDPDRGLVFGGTPITIVGELLSGPSVSTDVTVGGSPCTNLVVVNDNEVACETPAGAGLADVTVVNNEPDLVESSDTLSNAFNYLPDFLFRDDFESNSP